MIYLKKRQIQILETLLYKKRKFKMKQLAEQFDVSVRTIRKDLEAIEEWLNKKNFQLIKDANEGIWIPNNEEIKLKDFTQNNSDIVTILNQKDRQALIVLHLLNSDTPLTIGELSEKLQISYSTVVKDLSSIEKLVNAFGLTLIRKQNYGLEITGDETNIRKSITKIIMEHVTSQYLAQIIFEGNNKKIFPSNNFVEACLDLQVLNELRKILVSIAEMFNCQFSDYDYIISTLNLAVTIKRIRNQHEIEFSDQQKIGISDRIQYLMAKKLTSIIEPYYDIRFSEDEIIGITINLLGVRYISSYSSKETNKYSINSYLNVDIIEIVKSLFKKFEVFYGIDLSKNVDLLFNLGEHLKSTLFRLDNKLLVYNPLLDEIKSKYPYMFQFCSFISEEISKEISSGAIPEEEIAYITMYFQMALENFSKSQLKTPKVLVICGNSNVLINYLRVRLEKTFPELDIIGPVSQNHLNFSLFKENDFDFVISTVPFQSKKHEVCIISPLLTKEDIDLVHENIISLAKYRAETIKRKKEFILKDVLKEDTIKVGVEVEDWKQAIRAAGELLLNTGGIHPSYINKMIETAKKLGPYIVIAPGIALTHAAPTDGVKFPCFSLITLKSPVNFGNPDKDPVRLLIAIAVVDHKAHVKALIELIEIIGDQENLRAISNAREEGQLLDLLLKAT